MLLETEILFYSTIHFFFFNTVLISFMCYFFYFLFSTMKLYFDRSLEGSTFFSLNISINIGVWWNEIVIFNLVSSVITESCACMELNIGIH